MKKRFRIFLVLLASGFVFLTASRPLFAGFLFFTDDEETFQDSRHLPLEEELPPQSRF